MRERRPISAITSTFAWITPAYAGKTMKLKALKPQYKDHPRVCGKDTLLLYSCATFIGSPPRMRERQCMSLSDGICARITPAYAGKTIPRVHQYMLKRDHPRVCGKDCMCVALSLQPAGSPPRMRERLKGDKHNFDTMRITPAYAGKTLKNPNKMTISIT